MAIKQLFQNFMIKKTQGKLIFAKSASGDYQFIDINSYNLFKKTFTTDKKHTRQIMREDLSNKIEEVKTLLKGKRCKSCSKKSK